MRITLLALITCSCRGSIVGSVYREGEDRVLNTKSTVSGWASSHYTDCEVIHTVLNIALPTCKCTSAY